ncbi:MAG: hypothetical protein WBN40_14055 [Pseudomonadales bacterium]
MKPVFVPGRNIAVKTPAHEFDSVVHFYQKILGFKQLPDIDGDSPGSVCFEFGDKMLWIDRVDGISQSEIWLEVSSNNLDGAQTYLENAGCAIRNEIEELPASVSGFWLNSPSNIIHLVTKA